MATKRELATQEILKWVEEILPGSENTEMYAIALTKLSDSQFSDYMSKLKSGAEILYIVQPNLKTGVRLDIRRNLKVAKKLGHSFFERLWLTDQDTGVTYLTKIPYLVVDLPLRKQAQTLSKKVSIPHDNSHVDDLSGQPTGESKGGGLSFPEIQMLHAQGLDRSIEELAKFRGGDEKSYRAMNKQMIDTGSVALDSIQLDSKVKSTEVLSTLFKCMHIDNNL